MILLLFEKRKELRFTMVKIKFFNQIVLMVFGLLLDVSKDKLGPSRKATTSTVPEKFILQNK